MVGRVSRHVAWIAAVALLLLSACPNPLLQIVKREVANYAGQPEIQVSKGGIVIPSGGAVDLGAGITGQSKPVTFTIQNLGGATLTLSGNPEISNDASSSFSISSLPYTSIDGGQNSTFIVDFRPPSNGLKTATLTINNSDADEGTYTFTMSGTGVGAAGPDINVLQGSSPVDSTHPYSFGGVRTGTVKDVMFTIQNIGTVGSVLWLTPTPPVSIAGSSAFIVLSQPDDTTSIPYNGNRSFTLRFQPGAAGDVEATVSIASDDSDENPYTFAINGSGREPDIQLWQGDKGGISLADSTGLCTFDDVPADGNNEATGIAVTFTIENTGSYPLTISDVTLSGDNSADFDIASRYSSPVAVGGTTTFSISFDPLARGTRPATVNIASDAPGAKNPYTFTITGTGTFAPKVYWVNRAEMRIWRANLNGSNPEPVTTEALGDPVGLAIDQAGDFMYWTENMPEMRIMKARLDGSGAARIDVTQPLMSQPYGIVLDVAGNAMYWTEWMGELGKAALDGSGCVHTPATSNAFGIAVGGGDLFWSEWSSNRIWWGGMEPFMGGAQTSLPCTRPAGLAWDSVPRKLYWADREAGQIVCWWLGFPGGRQWSIPAGGPLPNFLALDLDPAGGKIYWTEETTGIWRANLDGTNIEMIVGGQPMPYGIALDLVP